MLAQTALHVCPLTRQRLTHGWWSYLTYRWLQSGRCISEKENGGREGPNVIIVLRFRELIVSAQITFALAIANTKRSISKRRFGAGV